MPARFLMPVRGLALPGFGREPCGGKRFFMNPGGDELFF